MRRLKEAMLLLIANDAPLGAEWLDPALKGEWADHRECHIGGDFLLIYQVHGTQINFVRAGTHSELFGESGTASIARREPPYRLSQHARILLIFRSQPLLGFE